MYSLPSLAPQDSYTLWYTSSTTSPPPFLDPSQDQSSDPFTTHTQNTAAHPSRRPHPNHRSPLARLRLDEEYAEHRRRNVQNFGASWLKPPGMPKSLFQLREEEREMKEHQEALRREQLAAELAEAEAEGEGGGPPGFGLGMMGEGETEGMEEGDVRDLDDDVPDADADVTGMGADEESESDEEDEEDDDDEENSGNAQQISRRILQAQVPQDVYREALARGQASQFAGDSASTIDDEEHSGMLQEEDLVHEHELHDEEEMNMDADLDAEVSDADEEYEHTDTEDELSSSEEESENSRLPQQASMVRSDGTQNSMDAGDLASFISGPSSHVGASSSPRLRRAPRS